MGSEVARVSVGARVEEAGFGRWFKRQRSLRGISISDVAAQTKLSRDRIAEIEAGDGLGSDGHARATARLLAEAIGADATEAVLQLGAVAGERGGAPRVRPRQTWLRHAPAAAAVLLLVAGCWLLADRMLSPDPAASRQVVYRPDYVQRLLVQCCSGRVEVEPRLAAGALAGTGAPARRADPDGR